MKPMPFEYHAPETIEDAVGLLSSLPNPRMLAGGQSLVPMLNFRIAAPDHLIDLNRISDLQGIEDKGDVLVIGAMTRQREIERSELVFHHCPLLHAAVQHVGHQQTRNRGTIGGSICHMDPAAEFPVAAAALDPIMVAHGPGGKRRFPFSQFCGGYLTNTLEPGEMLERIEFPKISAGGQVSFVELSRRPADFAIVSVAAQILRAGNRVTEARIAIGGLSAGPVRLTEAESMLMQRPFDTDAIAQAGKLARRQPSDGDSLNPTEYRQHLAGVLTMRALRDCMEPGKRDA